MEPTRDRSLAKSREYFTRARHVIPSCTQTFSKGPTQFVQGVAPIFLQRGRGSHVWDVDGNEYIDYPMALGPIVLGYDDPDVLAAVRAQLADGVTFSLAHPLEVEVAETLAKIVPCAEMVRFGKNGSDVTSGAVRAARAHPGPDVIAFSGTPDLACLGKAMANGFPLSAVVGRREIMEVFDEIFFSCTFGGEAVSLAAARATIAKLREKDVIEHLWRQGARLRDGYNALAREAGLAGHTRCIGYPPRTVLTFTDGAGAESLAMKSLFQQEMIKRGILIAGGFNLCYAHSDDDIRRTLDACRESFGILARALAERRVEQLLEGPVIQPVFRSA